MSTSAVIQMAAEADQDWMFRGDPRDPGHNPHEVIYTLWISEMAKMPNYARDYQESMVTNVNYGQACETTLPRYGDLIDAIIAEVDLVAIEAPTLTDASGATITETGAYYSNAIGYAIFDVVELEMGNIITQKITAENMWTWEELHVGSGNRMRELIGRFEYADDIEDDMITWSSQRQRVYVVFPFFNHAFGQPSLALPLCGMFKHDIKVRMYIAQMSQCVSVVYKPNDDNAADDPWLLDASTMPKNTTSNATLQNSDLRIRLLVSFVYITQKERQLFLGDTVNYIIVQDQNLSSPISADASSTNYQVNLHHPVMCFDWHIRPNNWTAAAGRRRYSVGFRDRFDYSAKLTDGTLLYGDVQDPFTEAQFKFSTHNRFPPRVAPIFYKRLIPYFAARNQFTGYEYLWSFADKVFQYNITSTCNFSRIDNVFLELTHPTSTGLVASTLYFHAVNYNGAYVEDGMWGVIFSG